MSYRVITDKKFLNKPCKEATLKNKDKVISRIKGYLIANKGKAIGIAANQLGFNVAIFGIWLLEKNKIDIYVNPVIYKDGYLMDSDEGCMSIKNGTKHFGLKRRSYVEVHDENHSEPQIFRDYMATVIQHEYDHTQGVLISDLAVVQHAMKEADNGKS